MQREVSTLEEGVYTRCKGRYPLWRRVFTQGAKGDVDFAFLQVSVSDIDYLEAIPEAVSMKQHIRQIL